MRFHSFVPNRTIFSDFPVVQMGFVLWALQTVYIQCSTVQYSAGAAESVVLEDSAVCSVGVQYSVGQYSVEAAESVQRKQVTHASTA